MNSAMQLKVLLFQIGFIVFICSCKKAINENKSYPTDTKRVVFVDSINGFSFLSVEKPKIETTKIYTTINSIGFDEKDYSYTLGDINYIVSFYKYPNNLNDNEIIQEEFNKYKLDITEKKVIEHNGIKGIEFSGNSSYLNNKREFVYTSLTQRIYVNNRNVYLISVNKKNKSDKLKDKNITDFFNSFKISKDSTLKSNSNINNKMNETKYNINVTSINDFNYLIETKFNNIDNYLTTRNWIIIQDDREIGKGVVFLKEEGVDSEQIIFYKNSIMYSTNKDIFFAITSEIKNNCKYFKTSLDEDGSKSQLYFNDKCRYAYNTSKKEVIIAAK